MKRFVILFIATSFGQMVAFAQRVSPYQAGSYQPGLVHLRDFASLPAGLYILDYNYWAKSEGYYNRDGKKLDGIDIDLSFLAPEIGIVNLSLEPVINGYVNVPVFFFVSKFTLLGGARYMASINPSYLSANYRLNINLNEDLSPQGNASGFGDLSFMPLALSWSFQKKVDVGIWYSLYAPTGRYRTDGDNNIGQGFWTHQIQTPVYFYFMDQATAIGIIPTFEINGKVKDADLRAGNRFTLEYGISQYFTEWLEVEIMGLVSDFKTNIGGLAWSG